MVICKYFQQGWCRYGQNCRYEHVSYNSKYTYHAPTASNQTTNTNTITDEQLVNQVQLDIQAAVHGGQWILSCYSPYKEKACFPGIPDLSQEEARLIIYEAKSNNTLEQAVTYMNNLFRDTRQKYEQLLQPSVQIIKVLRSLYKGEAVSSPFGPGNQSNTGFGSNASSIFRSALQNDPFQSSNASFSQQPNNNVFGRASNPNTNAFGSNPQSIFAQGNQNVFGSSQSSNIFQTQQQQQQPIAAAKSIFAQANQSTFGQQHQQQQQQNVFATKQPDKAFGSNSQQNVFGAPQPQQNVFATSQPQNPFNMQQNPNTNVFQQSDPFKLQPSSNNVFGVTNNAFQQQPIEEDIYSKVEDLSPSDLEAFKNDEFTLGFIPALPPPRNLCV